MSAVIFDLDGTLIDSAPDIHAAVNTVFAALNLPATTFPETKSLIGRGVPAFIVDYFAAKNIEPKPGLAAEIQSQLAVLYKDAHELTTVYDGAEACLRQLKSDGYMLGLCTNKPEQPTHTVLAHFGLTDLFTAHSFGDGPYGRKPDAAPVHHVLGALGATSALYVGDSETDAATAQNAQLPMALFTQGYRKVPIDQIPHNVSFDHFDQLRAIIDKYAPLKS